MLHATSATKHKIELPELTLSWDKKPVLRLDQINNAYVIGKEAGNRNKSFAIAAQSQQAITRLQDYLDTAASEVTIIFSKPKGAKELLTIEELRTGPEATRLAALNKLNDLLPENLKKTEAAHDFNAEQTKVIISNVPKSSLNYLSGRT